MSVELFLDANVLVYAVSMDPTEAAKKARAREILSRENFGISAQVLQEFYVTVTRKIKRPISRQDAWDYLDSLGSFPCVAIDADLVRRGTALSERFQISYWDGSIIAAAERLMTSTLFSEDLNHSQWYESVQVINPFR